MIKLFLLLSFLSLSSFASEERKLILEKHVRSGYVLPEHSFQKDCTIYDNGNVEVVLITGGTASGFTAQLSPRKVWEIRRLVQVAKRFKIVSGGILCDGGDHIVTGHRMGKPVLIKEMKDCFSNKWRKGWAATRLKLSQNPFASSRVVRAGKLRPPFHSLPHFFLFVLLEADFRHSPPERMIIFSQEQIPYHDRKHVFLCETLASYLPKIQAGKQLERDQCQSQKTSMSSTIRRMISWP